MLNAATTRFAKEAAAADQLIRVGNAPQTKDIPPSELAAWTTLCSLLLNLDEAMTRH